MQRWRNRWVSFWFGLWVTSLFSPATDLFCWAPMCLGPLNSIYAQEFPSSLGTKKHKAPSIFSLRSKLQCSLPATSLDIASLWFWVPQQLACSLPAPLVCYICGHSFWHTSAFLSVLLRSWWWTWSQPEAHGCGFSVPQYPPALDYSGLGAPSGAFHRLPGSIHKEQAGLSAYPSFSGR